MQLKCRFCKYKALCIPEQEEGLTEYKKLVKNHLILVHDYVELAEKYKNLRENLENYIKEHEK